MVLEIRARIVRVSSWILVMIALVPDFHSSKHCANLTGSGAVLGEGGGEYSLLVCTRI